MVPITGHNQRLSLGPAPTTTPRSSSAYSPTGNTESFVSTVLPINPSTSTTPVVAPVQNDVAIEAWTETVAGLQAHTAAADHFVTVYQYANATSHDGNLSEIYDSQDQAIDVATRSDSEGGLTPGFYKYSMGVVAQKDGTNTDRTPLGDMPILHSPSNQMRVDVSKSRRANSSDLVVAYPMCDAAASEATSMPSSLSSPIRAEPPGQLEQQGRRKCGALLRCLLIAIVAVLLLISGYCASGSCRPHRRDPPAAFNDGGVTSSPSASPASTPKPAALLPVQSPRHSKRPTSSDIVTWTPFIRPHPESPNGAPTAGPVFERSDSNSSTSTLENNRASAIVGFINSITLSERTIVEANKSTALFYPEDLALQWLSMHDPLMLWPNTSWHQFRLRQRYSLLTLWFQQDKRPLMEMNNKSATIDSSSWLNTTAWLVVGDECQWAGVACAPRRPRPPPVENEIWNTVIHIELGSNNLRGRIPADVGLLTSLVRFNVHNNSLYGSLPTTIGRFVDIDFFRVSNNSLTGTIPTAIQDWNRIKFASFHSNAFENGPMPDDLCQKNVSYLIADCSICSCCPMCYNESGIQVNYNAFG